MANTDRPRGFRPYGELKHVGIYTAAGTIYPGDMVKQDGGASSTSMAENRTRVVVATNGAAILGCALNYAAAGSKVRVADDPQQLFSAQGDGSDFDNQADLGNNAGLLATAGDATYKQSRQEVKTSDIGSGATVELKVLGYVPRQDAKNQMGAFAELIVKINNHQLGSSTGTAGV